jgi:23S rRNA (cytosine1962-C5)-methyltransferase
MTIDTKPFANRLEKNARHLARWAKRAGVSCYRIYDCDIPEFPVIVDRYLTASGVRIHLQEVDTGWRQTELEHRQWTEAIALALARVLGLAPSALVVKRRVRQRVNRVLEAQYQPSGVAGEDLLVEESGHRFIVNLEAYLDTGLFLDHRITRGLVGARAAGKRFLNLFAYTGSFSVYAAKGGARASVTVDLSNTYCSWAKRNFELNGIDLRLHSIVRDDAIAWLKRARAAGERFDLIMLDPPSFSNSKRMQGILDVQRDHASLIDACMAILHARGELFFSNNLRSFVLDPDIALRHQVANISARTIPEDFRDKRIHQTFRITARDGTADKNN